MKFANFKQKTYFFEKLQAACLSPKKPINKNPYNTREFHKIDLNIVGDDNEEEEEDYDLEMDDVILKQVLFYNLSKWVCLKFNI